MAGNKKTPKMATRPGGEAAEKPASCPPGSRADWIRRPQGKLPAIGARQTKKKPGHKQNPISTVGPAHKIHPSPRGLADLSTAPRSAPIYSGVHSSFECCPHVREGGQAWEPRQRSGPGPPSSFDALRATYWLFANKAIATKADLWSVHGGTRSDTQTSIQPFWTAVLIQLGPGFGARDSPDGLRPA